PVQPNAGQCARYCTDASDFTLRPGSTYTYDYETTTVTTVQGGQEKTQIQITAQADIEVLSKCELSLRLRGVTLKLSDPESPDYLVSLRGAREFAKTIERNILRFSFQNGQVEHVCPSENAPTWVTNIQKGVLSAFQSFSVKPEWTTRTLETDVLGKCTAEYHSLGRNWQGTHTVRKLKDLSSCTERENYETYLQGSAYSQDFQTMSLPVVKGSQECEQVIGDNFLQTSTCNEKLIFRPFSNRGNGVVATVSQKLIYAATSERRFTGNDYRPTTEPLLYTHAKQEVSSAKIEEETEMVLRELCDAAKVDISISVPRKFSGLVYKMKKLSLRSLKSFYQKIDKICPQNTDKARKFFMDAIPLFASDARKFSTASEAHYFLESIDSGIHVDSHLIFSTDSYLPRSAMFNLTVDIFGKSCNLFQIDGRMEGLEHVVESFFGPGGYFPQKNIAKILREKRSVDNNKLNLIDSQFNQHYRNPHQPYGSLDVKVFGTSMWYEQFRSNEDGTPEINLLDIVTKLAEENDKEYSRSFMFLDTTFTVPMTSGLPLKIALNGTASVGLKIGGKFDVKSFEQVDVLGHIEPSGAVEISGLLTVDAGHFASSGMRIISTMHSSSVLDGKVQVRNGEVVKAQLNMPRDRIDVFNIQSKMYLVHGTEEREKAIDKREGTHLQSCTGRGISKVFGVKICSSLDLPPYRPNSPLQPLNGPAAFSLFIEKTDPTLKSYNFDAQWKNEMKKGGFVKHGVFSLNTPESRVDRDVKMELYVNEADHTATLKIKTPVKKFGVNAKLVDGESKKLDFSVNVDDKDYFSLQSELGIVNVKSSMYNVQSSLEVRIPSGRFMAATGTADIRLGQKYSGQLKIEDLTEKPILAKGNFEIGKKDRYDIEASLSSFPLDGTVKGYAQMGDNIASRFNAEYRILEGKMNKLSIVGKMRNLSAAALTKYSGSLNLQASVLPEWNTELVFETMKTTGHIENTVSVSLGDGARSRIHTIKLQEILRYEGSLSDNKVDGSIKLLYPEKNINYGLSVKHENTENSLKNTLEIQYAKNRQISTDVQLKKSTGNLLSVAGDVKLSYPGREAAVQAELAQNSNKEYRGTASCQWQTGRRVAAVLHYKDKCEGSRLKYEIDGNMNLPESSPITFATIVSYHRGQFAGSAEMSQGNDKYRAKADITAGNGLNHRMAGQLMIKNDVYGIDAAVNSIKDKVNGNVEVKMPNRQRATAKFEGRIGNGQF
ncbi:Apolipophorin, partial [Araneus ventricosus]